MTNLPPSDKLIPADRRYVFLGWEFERKHPFVMSWHKLENPESVGLDYSYAGVEDRAGGVREACAWLISHWWEHRLRICPCLGTDHAAGAVADGDSSFRREFIRTVMEFGEVAE